VPDEATGLMAQMDALVREHLPEKVGATLRKELDRLEKVESELIHTKADLVTAKIKIEELNKLKLKKVDLTTRANELDNRQEALAVQQRGLDIKEAVMTAVESERALRIADLKQVTTSVFANNRFKYERHGHHDVVNPDSYGPDGCYHAPTNSTVQHEETVEGEGDVPPVGQAPGATPG
jgi:hypothetical protein